MRAPSHNVWRDPHNKPFLTSEGYLTDYAKEVMTELECYTLEDLFNRLENSKKGGYAEGFIEGRSDVQTSGHIADTNDPNSEFFNEK